MERVKIGAVVVLLLIAAFLFLRPYLNSRAESNRAVDARQAALRLLAERVVRDGTPVCVLVLANPYAKKGGKFEVFEQAGIRGIKQGLPSSTRVEVVTPAIWEKFRDEPQKAPFPSDSSTPLSYLMDPSSLGRLVEDYPDCQVIISLVGLPNRIDTQPIWRKESPVRFALLQPDLKVLGSAARVLSAFESDRIIAVVVADQGSDEPMIVDAGNVKDILASQPGLLGLRPSR